jgi:V8-like Glu-specific endopeptidase
MIDRQHPDDEYSPFVAVSPRARTPGAPTPWIEHQARAADDHESEWRMGDGSTESPDGEQYTEKNTLHPDCTPSGIGIYGKDDRTPVANTLNIPYRWICHLFIQQRDSNGVVTNSGATGILVSPRHVLTAAHVISSSKPDNRNLLVTTKAEVIRVSPARDASDTPFGTLGVSSWVTSPNWNSTKMPPSYDFALLTLDKDVGNVVSKRLGGKKLCYWGEKSCKLPAVARRVDPKTIDGATALTAGYAGNRAKGLSPIETSGVLTGAHEKSRIMTFTADACKGQSGSPVWVTVGGEHRLVGMLVRADPLRSVVVRVTRELSTQLRQWMAGASDAFVEAPATPTPEVAETSETEFDVGESDASEWYQESHAESDGEGEWLNSAAPSCRCGSCGRRSGEAEDESWETESVSTTDASEAGELEMEFASDSESPGIAEWNESFADTEQEAWESEASPTPGIAPKEPRPRISRPSRESNEDESLFPEQLGGARTVLRRLPFMAGIAGPLDPGYYNPDGTYRASPALQTCVTAVGALAAARGAQIALVDLSKGLASPEFAGVRHTAPLATASTGKLPVMYAAFQLQEDLRRLRAATGAATLADLITAQTARWTAMQTPAAGAAVTAISGHLGRKGDLMTWKGKPIDLPAGSVVPDIDRIIDSVLPALEIRRSTLSYVTGPASLCDEAVVLNVLEHQRGDWSRGVEFEQRMRMMIGLSDNRATTTCINDIGFAYINALMVQSGLWHPARGGGLWLSGNYSGARGRTSPLGGFVQNGTAGSLVSLLTLLARGRLATAAASAAMLAMMNKDTYPGALTRSPVAGALASLPGATIVFSKLGLLGTVFDAAIVKRTEGGKSLHYAIVIMNADGDVKLGTIARALHQCIRTNNGLP